MQMALFTYILSLIRGVYDPRDLTKKYIFIFGNFDYCRLRIVSSVPPSSISLSLAYLIDTSLLRLKLSST